MKGEDYFEQIPAGAISPQMPECKAILVNVQNQKHLVNELGALYSTGSYKIYVVNTTPAKLGKVLDKIREVNVPAIVNCGMEIPDLEKILPKRPYNASLLSGESYANHNSSILAQLLNDPFLVNFNNIGFQGYRYSPQSLQKLKERYFEDMRLGIIRDDISLCEPLLRDSEYVFLDMCSIRYSDYPYSTQANPNGLYAEEACQIARYIGLGQNLSAVFIFGELKFENQIMVCTKLIAEIIWHICEGIAVNLHENPMDPISQECYLRKIVSLGGNGQDIVFITSTYSQRWWMEVSVDKGNNIKIIPCSVNDYQTACRGEVPLRWLFFYTKYAIL
ncbi:MAG: hypothetical protein RR555_09040 [Bacteroidales bacterium]